MAIRRSQHPLFKAWWDMGKALHAGEEFPLEETPPLVSSNNSIKCGFALMSCSSSIENNVQTIRKHLKQAAADRLDLVIFPELSVTGDREEDIRKADPKALDAAVESIRRSAQEYKLTVVFGAPSHVNGQRRNSAYAIGPDGSLLTRYDQIVVDRPELFQGGMSTKAMWFQVHGVWSIVTIGDDVIWNEIAELAALRGARLHCHLRHDRNTSPAQALLHDQLVAAFASFRMLTVVSNPLFPELKGQPDACFCLGSGIWDDLEAGDWCAVKINVGRPWEGVFSAPRIVPGSANPVRQTGYWRKGTLYRTWMMAGAAAMDRDATERPGLVSTIRLPAAGEEDVEPSHPSWRPLPLVASGTIDPNWKHLWGGGFSVMEDGSLRTDCDDTGMGLLLYTKEQFGDCQIRVLYRSEDTKSNAGVYVRIDDAVLDRANDPLPLRLRDSDGRLTKATLQRIAESSDAEREAWYPVHHGYEVQICGAGDEYHRTGSIYSLAPAAPAPLKAPADWKTMIITLQGNLILVDVDGKRLTAFDPHSPKVPARKHWSEPRREPKRPLAGFIGLQNHDPGDVVYFKEVSVRPLGSVEESSESAPAR